ncbi:MAG: hypothetical protein GXX85_15345, partial [Ignavibacteria bacterium]|nr:hypothetical protein [Ignavibacteria bacterium]
MKIFKLNRLIAIIKYIVLFFIVFRPYVFGQQDLTIRLNENDLNQAISTLVDARAINFGDYTGAFIASAWFINLEYGSVDIKSNNQITIHAKVEARAVNIIKIIESVTVNVDLDINGILRLDQLEDGYKLVFKAQSVTNDVIRIGSWAQWSDLLSGGLSSAFIQKIPEIELCAGTKLLPDAITDYFTSSIPTLSTNENEIILYYTVGNPSTVAFNEVNQKTNIGTIEEIVNGLVFSSGNSPRTFTWGNNETHQLQTPQELLDDNNLKFKYKNWFKGDETNPIQDISPRRIQLTVDGNKNFKAKFLQAQRVQISNLLEGAYSGGTVTYEATTSSAIDLYDYKNNTLVHPLSSTVTNGTLGRNWFFSGWSDGNTNQSRTIKVNGDLNIKANYKGSQVSSDASAYTNNSQRKIVKTADGWLHQVYKSMGRVFIEHSSNNGTSWVIGNNGQPLDNGEGKCPSIDWWYTPSGGSSPELHNLVVAYQQKEGSAYSIRYALFEKQNGN